MRFYSRHHTASLRTNHSQVVNSGIEVDHQRGEYILNLIDRTIKQDRRLQNASWRAQKNQPIDYDTFQIALIMSEMAKSMDDHIGIAIQDALDEFLTERPVDILGGKERQG